LADLVKGETNGGRTPLENSAADAILGSGAEIGFTVRDHRGAACIDPLIGDNHWEGGEHVQIGRLNSGVDHIPVDASKP
jgi:hypothetical protein